MLEALKIKSVLATTGLVAAAARAGLLPLDPETIVITVGGLMVRRVRDYVWGSSDE